jgi:hypothetical protein
VNHLGEEIKPSDIVKGEISERVDRIDAFYGSKSNYVLIQFVKRMLDNYRRHYDSIVI